MNSNSLICDKRDASEMVYTAFQKVLSHIYYKHFIYTMNNPGGNGDGV